MDKRRQQLQQIQDGARPLFAISEDHSNGAHIARHDHPVHQLLYAISGVVVARCGRSIFTLPPDRALWIPAGVTHSFRMHGQVRLRTAYFAKEYASELGASPTVLRVSALARELLLALVNKNQPRSATYIRQSILPMLIQELKDQSDDALGLELPSDPRAAKVARHFIKHPSDRTPVVELAETHAIGLKTLARRFLDETGLPPDSWRRAARMNEAVALLRSGQSVSEVSFELGFETLSGFSQSFKRHFDYLPSRSRDQI